MDQRPRRDVRAKIIKSLGENMGVNLYDIGWVNGFLEITPKAWATEEKWINWTSSKLKLLFIKEHPQERKITHQKNAKSHRMVENRCKRR